MASVGIWKRGAQKAKLGYGSLNKAQGENWAGDEDVYWGGPRNGHFHVPHPRGTCTVGKALKKCVLKVLEMARSASCFVFLEWPYPRGHWHKAHGACWLGHVSRETGVGANGSLREAWPDMSPKGTWWHTESTRSSQETSGNLPTEETLGINRANSVSQEPRSPLSSLCLGPQAVTVLGKAQEQSPSLHCPRLDGGSVSKVLGMSQLWKSPRFRPVCLPRYQERPGKAWLSQRAAGRFISMGYQLKTGSSKTRKSREGVSGNLRVGLGSKHTFYLKGPRAQQHHSVGLQGARHLLWMQILST